MSPAAKVTELPAPVAVPEEVPLQIDVSELLNAYSQVAAQQITGLISRVAELEATLAAMRRAQAAQG